MAPLILTSWFQPAADNLSNHIWLELLGEVLKHDVIGSLQTGNQSANSLYSSRQILPPEVIIFTSQDGD